MKIIRSGLLILLALAWLAGTMQTPAGASPLKSVDQIVHVYYDTSWHKILPDGTIQPFVLQPGQSFIMTGLYVRFYANSSNTGPYRLYFKNGQSIIWIEPLQDIYNGSTMWGGGRVDTFDPGISMSVLPTLVVQQLPPPPTNPNSGSVVPGTFYAMFVGYVVP